MQNCAPLFLIVDLFCGAGGTTTGFAQAAIDGNTIAKVIACVNHDAKAIQSHWMNHPEVKHFEEDIRTLDLTELIALVKYWKDIYPDAYLVLWASLECTNFSKAKGGLPRDADSRTLADHLFRYIEALQPDYVQIENVVEFMSWGPLDDNGKPISRKNGSDWIRWRNDLCKNYNYTNDWKELNSANFGAYTSRNRLFGVFAKPWAPVSWPQPTHSKTPSKLGMYGDLQKWKAVKEVLNFEDEGESIFTRSKPLSEKTLERIYAGLIKYTRVITTSDNQALVSPEFIAAYYGNGDNISSVDSPAPTIPTKDRCALVQPEYFIDKHFNTTQNQSIDQPAGTIMPNDKHRLVEAVPFIMRTAYDNLPSSIEEPAPVITANRKHHYLVNPAWGGNAGSIEQPCCVIVARQDKAPLYFIEVERGPVSIAIYDNDTACSIRIKQFMAAYGLVDIKMRMLRVNELLRIQGFPATYHLAGNQTDQKKFIGNSVVPHVVKCWCEAMGMNIIDKTKTKVA